MHSLDFLGELLAVLGAALGIVLLCQRIRVPPVVGFLIAGVALGPSGLGVIQDRESIERLAGIGVALLLFTVGLELSFRDLWAMRRAVLWGGAAQMATTSLLGFGIAALVGMPPAEAFFFGLAISLSSTALVLTVLASRGDAASPHGRASLALLIFQDLAVVPLLLLTPILSGQGGGLGQVGAQLGVAVMATIAALLFVTQVLPRALGAVARAGTPELFTIAVVLAALGTAFLTAKAGVSLALGAFLAGLSLAGSRYGAEVVAEVLPFKHVFNSIFFVSVGMLADPAGIIERPLLTVGVVVGIVVAKAFVLFLVTLGLGQGPRVATLVALSLCQVGEFAFVLAHVGREAGLLDRDNFDLLLLVTLISLALTPALMAAAAPLTEWLSRFAALGRAFGIHEPTGGEDPSLERDHVVVCGYGLEGRAVTRVLERLEVPNVVLELNPAYVSSAAAEGAHVVFGDAARPAVLRHVHVEAAKAVVVAIEDRVAAKRIVRVARSVNPSAYVLARARTVEEAAELQREGADEVVPQELETSLELASRVMNAYGLSASAIFVEQALVRRDGYRMLLDQSVPSPMPTLRELLTQAELSTVSVEAGSEVEGRSLAALALPREEGVSVLCVERGGESLVNPEPDLCLKAGDKVVVFGPPRSTTEVLRRFRRMGEV